MAVTPFATQSPAPAKPRTKVNLVGDELVLRWRNGMSCAAVMLIAWLSGWTAGCVMLVRELLTKFEWFLLLFATPFFAAWVAVSGLVFYLLFGRQRLVITRNELQCLSQAIVTYRRRVIPLDEVARAAMGSVVIENDDGPATTERVVRIETLGQPVQFAQGISAQEAAWLAETINVCLDNLAPRRAALSAFDALHDELPNDLNDEDPLADWFTDNVEGDPVLVFQPSRDRLPQPSDSHWKLSRRGRTLEFTHRGRWSPGAVGGATFLNLFWNGIVGVFVVELVEDFRWFLALFLAPFVLVGLVMVFAWLCAITAPLWGVQYRIRFGRIECRRWSPAFGKTSTQEFERLDRIEITEPGFSTNTIDFPPKNFSEGDYQLALIDDQMATLCKIEALTEGEALWMADTIMSEHPEVFSRRR